MPDLADGESVQMKGSSGSTYTLKNTGGVYSCNCPAWRNQSIAIEKRTCKHLKKLRGDQAESDRIGSSGPAPTRSSGASDEDAASKAPPLLLAHSWENDVDLAGWWMSEKLDGVRAYWDGKTLLSRQGNVFHAPDWFLEALPTTPLDGELWLDRKSFQRTVSIVRRQDKSDHWKQIKFVVFDAPQATGGFEDRMAFLDDCCRRLSGAHVRKHDHALCQSLDHLRSELARVEGLGGEGLMLRQPASHYETGRSFTLLKVKTFHDAEATVISHQGGAGRHKGRLGALLVKLPDGTEFSVGTGFSDAQRENPPPIGRSITFRYQELSDGGVPRFPSFVRAAIEPPKKSAAATKPPALSQKAPAAIIPAPASPSGTRRFEFVDDKSSKFWEITQTDTAVTVRYGRLGTNGQTQTKSFTDPAAAAQHSEKLIAEKTEKGYVEK